MRSTSCSKTLLNGNGLDDEILSMLARRPRIFHLGMLPSCRSDVTGIRAAENSKAHMEAAAARLKLFELELKGDWELIEETKAAKAELAELLRWLDLEHQRSQTAMGLALVSKRMSATHPTVVIDEWDKLPGRLSLLCKSWVRSLRQGRAPQSFGWISTLHTPATRLRCLACWPLPPTVHDAWAR